MTSTNPPIIGVSANTAANVIIPEIGGGFYPTGNALGQGQQDAEVFPYSGLGNYCINCHASAVSEATYSTHDNILTAGIRYKWLGAGRPAPRNFSTSTKRLESDIAPAAPAFTSPLMQANPAFLKLFPQLPDRDFSQLLKTQSPAETYNHVVSLANANGGIARNSVESSGSLVTHSTTPFSA